MTAALISMAQRVEMLVRADPVLSRALDNAQPETTNNIRALLSQRHGAIEVTLRFDIATIDE